jgi:uncharacterized protein DUF3309
VNASSTRIRAGQRPEQRQRCEGEAGAKRTRLDRNRGLVWRVYKYTRGYVPGDAMLGTILLIILILLLIGVLPTWPYSGGWGYYPSGGFGLLLIIIIVLLLAGRI